MDYKTRRSSNGDKALSSPHHSFIDVELSDLPLTKSSPRSHFHRERIVIPSRQDLEAVLPLQQEEDDRTDCQTCCRKLWLILSAILLFIFALGWLSLRLDEFEWWKSLMRGERPGAVIVMVVVAYALTAAGIFWEARMSGTGMRR